MFKYESEGIVTDDPQVAVMYLGEACMFDNGDWFGIWEIARCGISSGFDVTKTITIPYLAVWESLQPVEGEAQFYVPSNRDAGDQPIYVFVEHMKTAYADDGDFPCALKLAVNHLTIGKTVGELRELVERCEG